MHPSARDMLEPQHGGAVRPMATPSTRSSSPAATTAPGADTAACTLQEGLRLSRVEFERRSRERRISRRPSSSKGRPRAVRRSIRQHARPYAAAVWWLGAYAVATQGVHVVDNATLRLDGDNELQPDAALLVDPRAGGQARISADDYVEGAPELVAEIAASSAPRDLRDSSSCTNEWCPASTSSGASRMAASTGSSGRAARSVSEQQAPTALSAARSSPASGWTPQPCCKGDLAAVLRTLQRGLAEPVTLRSRPPCAPGSSREARRRGAANGRTIHQAGGQGHAIVAP